MTSSLSERFASRSILWTVALVASIYMVTMILMPRQGLWMVDNENRFLQVQALADNGFSSYAIDWPGRTIDPGLDLSPLRFNPEGSFQVEKNGQLISVFQPAFILISAVFYRLLGYWGLYILPLGAAVLLLIGVARLAAVLYQEKSAPHLAVLLTGLATPVWFYSQTFWEHTTAACLCVWGMVMVIRFLAGNRRQDLATGFAFLVAAVFFRDVLGIFAVLVLVLLLMRDRKQGLKTTLTAGAVLVFGVALLMLLQWSTTGKPLGFHADTLMGSESGLAGHLRDRVLLFYLFFCAALPERGWSLVLAAPFVVAFLFRPRLTGARLRSILPWWVLAALISGAVFLFAFLTAPNTLRHLLSANSFFLASPILILGLIRQKEAGWISTGGGLLLTVTCLYLVAYSLVAPWAGAVSLHWGARPVFTLYPLFGVLAAGTLSQWSKAAVGKGSHGGSIVIGLLVLLSVVAQVGSVELLGRKKAFSEQLSRTVAGFSGPVVVSNVWWLGHEMYSVFFDKSIFYIRTQMQLDRLEAALYAKGYREIIFASRPSPGPSRPGVMRIEDGGWNFYSLDFIRAPVKDPAK